MTVAARLDCTKATLSLKVDIVSQLLNGIRYFRLQDLEKAEQYWVA